MQLFAAETKMIKLAMSKLQPMTWFNIKNHTKQYVIPTTPYLQV